MIYFIQCNGYDGPIKIGRTNASVESRMATIQSQNPGELRLLAAIPGGRPKESQIQSQFAHLNIRGEWYEAADELLSYIAHVKGDPLLHRLRVMQLQNGWTDEQLANKLDVSPAYVSKVLSYNRQPGRKFLTGIVTAFPELAGETIAYLAGRRVDAVNRAIEEGKLMGGER